MPTPTAPWFVEVVHVTSLEKQQEVLKLFHGVAGLTASGITSGHDHFVVFGAVDQLMKGAAEALISDIDHDAVLTYNSNARPQPRSHMTPGYPSGPWTASLN